MVAATTISEAMTEMREKSIETLKDKEREFARLELALKGKARGAE